MMKPAAASVLVVVLLLAAAVAAGAAAAQQDGSGGDSSSCAAASPVPVLLDHDGGVDDHLTLMLLLAAASSSGSDGSCGGSSARIDLQGVTIVEGDSIGAVAVNTTLKLLAHLRDGGKDDAALPVVALQPVPVPNQFPMRYRAQGLGVDLLPALNANPARFEAVRRRALRPEPAHQVLAELVLRSPRPVTIVATGPLTNVALALQGARGREVAANIERVWWMGGALRMPGNTYEPGSDGSAEWNAYADPDALAEVLGNATTAVPLTLTPLDATNAIPITPDFLLRFGALADRVYGGLAGTIWTKVMTWFYAAPQDPYFAWDTLTAACFLESLQEAAAEQQAEEEQQEGRKRRRRGFCGLEHGLTVASVLRGPGAGATVLVDGDGGSGSDSSRGSSSSSSSSSSGSGGRRVLDAAGSDVTRELSPARRGVSAVTTADAEGFRRFILAAFDR